MLTLSIERGFTNQFSAKELDDLLTRIKAIIYARVSTDDQAKHGFSLESQVDRCHEKLVKDYAINDDEMIALIEMGEMGDDPNRPAFAYVKWLIAQGIGRKFAVLHPDRLSRSLRQQVEFIEDVLIMNGVDLVSVEVPFDPNNPESSLLFHMQGAIAQYNKAKILANSKRGRKTKVKNGQIPGIRRVFGYTFDKDHDILIENPKEKETYLKMVNWILDGDFNLTSVARELSLLGIPAPNGDKWYQATVSRILKNPIYTGKFFYGKTEYKQDKGKTKIIKKPENEWQLVNVPAYIDDKTYNSLQQKLNNNWFKNRGATPKVTYLLKGLARCGRCGSAVVAGAPSRDERTKEIKYHYYVCSGKARKAFEVGTGRQVFACQGHNWRRDVIDEYVWNYLSGILANSEKTLQKIFKKQADPLKKKELIEKKKTLEISLNEKEAERMGWLRSNARGKITDSELDIELEPLEQGIKHLKESIKLIDDSIMSIEVNVDQLNSIKKNIDLFKGFIDKKIDNEDKRKFVKLLIKKVVLYDDEIEIYTSWDFEAKNFKSESVLWI